MFAVTFYSFKGGVGRTMALVNTSIALARAGRRVLVVDFDLEAPGLPSYSVFQQAKDCKGVVDYVTTYQSSGIAPDVSEYISPCKVGDDLSIWVMPAGCHTGSGYAEALNSIDWQYLYDHQEGYLMFEDLKQQWAQYEGVGFDYVLIDSRTGHTDVGGICTRQLPDAVVIMFLPNDQNIDGLVPIVDAIREEKDKAGRLRISLEFCASNVPDLDDDRDILASQIEKARSKLRYSRPLTTLRHYSSFDVLAQKVFVLDRPTSRLSKEYEDLRQAVIALNYEDPEGAKVALQRVPTEYENARRNGETSEWAEVSRKPDLIRSKHPEDGEIAFLAASVYSRIGDQYRAMEAFTDAIKLNHEPSRARLGRAFMYAGIGRISDAVADLREIAATSTSTIFELGPALEVLRELDEHWLDALELALERPDGDASTILALRQSMLRHRSALELMANHLESVSSAGTLDPEDKKVAKIHAHLAMIGSGQFLRAVETIRPDRNVPISQIEVVDLFNYAIAEWGMMGHPVQSTFERCNQVLASIGVGDANFHQCFALVAATLSQWDVAEREVGLARQEFESGLIFSCWRYLYLDAEEFHADLDEMRNLIESRTPLVPVFLAERDAEAVH